MFYRVVDAFLVNTVLLLLTFVGTVLRAHFLRYYHERNVVPSHPCLGIPMSFSYGDACYFNDVGIIRAAALDSQEENCRLWQTPDVRFPFCRTVAPMERKLASAIPQNPSGRGRCKNEPLEPSSDDGRSNPAIGLARPSATGDRPTATGFLSPSPSMTALREAPSRSESASDRNRGPRFKAVVDVMYYDAKQGQTSEPLKAPDARDVIATSHPSHGDESWGVASFDDGDGSHETARIASHLESLERFGVEASSEIGFGMSTLDMDFRRPMWGEDIFTSEH